MGTTDDIFHFLSDIDFIEKMDDNHIEKLRSVKQRLVDEFQD